MDLTDVAIPRPLTEKGKTRGRRGRGLDKRWKSSERKNSHWLVKNDGPETSAIYKAVQSRLGDGSLSGRVGFNTGLQFDSVSANYVGENKLREIPKWILDAWIQVTNLAREHKKHAVLFLDIKDTQNEIVFEGKKAKVPNMHIITAERHAQLLECERQIIQALRTSTN